MNFDSTFRALARAAVDRPGVVLLLALLYTGATALLWPRFTIEPDISRMLPEHDPDVVLVREIEQDAAAVRSLFVRIRGAVDDAALAALAEDLRQSPHLQQVDATRAELFGPTFERARSAPLWALAPEDLPRIAERLSGGGRRAALADSRERFESDPFAGREVFVADPLSLRWLLDGLATARMPIRLRGGTEHVVLDDDRGAILRLVGTRPPFDIGFSNALLDDVEARLAGFEFDLLGGYATARTDAVRIRSELTGSAIGSVVLVGLFLLVSLRSIVQPHLALIPVALSVVWTLPVAGALLGPQTPLSVSAAAVLIGLGVDFAIHYLAHFASAFRELPYRSAIERCHVDLWRPLVAGALTTVAAFLSLTLGHLPGLRSFAVLLAIGLVHAFVATLVLLPVLLRAWRHPTPPRTSPVVRALDRLARSRHGRLAAGIVVVTAVVGAVVGIGRLQFVTDPAALRPAAENAARAALERELGFAAGAVVALVPNDVPRERIDAGLARLRDAGAIRFANAPPLPTDAQRAAVAAFRSQTDDFVDATLEDLAAADLDPEPFRGGLEVFATMFAADPPPPPPLRVRELDGRTWFEIRCFLPKSSSTLARFDEIQAAFRDAIDERTRVVGAMLLMARLRDALLSDLEAASAIAGVACFAMVYAVLGSLRAALLACVPVLLGFAITLGFAAIAAIQLNPANFVALPMLLGIGVDDGIHYVARVRRGRDTHEGVGETPNAIWRTTSTTALGFGSLCLAESPGFASLGLLVIVGVFACLVATLLVLPVLTGAVTSRRQ